ncbi:MAG: SPOR domain-containing protein [Flavobacteriaceae bacterium]|jgi:hypothetical protein|nr:SPOR domain-containing protein [Formosa sp.]MDG1374616.1 SPOR domain-containing protein [Flavobacteriaceae bacterium]MDG2498584.1 SPOR domain-containing protein [Flavobacteriaceae bacterium]
MNLFNWKLIVVSVLFSGEVLAQEGVVSIQKSLEIDRVLALKKELNKDQGFIKIQVYSGNRIGAEEALVSFKTDFPEEVVEMRYETPNYKIWVGKFKTQLHADRELRVIKKKYPNAFPLKPKKP